MFTKLSTRLSARITARTLIAAFIATTIFPAGAASNVKYFAEGSVPQPIEIARLLAGPNFKSALKKRGLHVTGSMPAVSAVFADPLPDSGQQSGQQAGQQSAQPPQMVAMASTASTTSSLPSGVTSGVTLAPQPVVAEPAAAPAFAVAVPFGFDSAVLQPAAHEVLDNIAEGIKMVQLPGALVIEGHTDAKGNQAYNLRLSARRALAVKRYLAKHHGIASAKLKAVGKGQLEPLNEAQPFAAENRRVQFRMAA